MRTIFGNYGITDWDIHKDIPQIDVENLYPKTLEIQTYNPNPNWNKTWASFKEKVKYTTSYEPKCTKLNIEDVKLQLDVYRLGLFGDIFSINDVVKEIREKEKEKIMDKYTCEYVEKELKWLGNIHNLKVLTEIEKNKYVHAYYIDKNQLDRTMCLVIDVEKVDFGWLVTADEAICNRFDKNSIEFTYIDTDIAFEAYCKADVDQTKDIYRHMLNSVYGAKGKSGPKHKWTPIAPKPSLPKIKDVKFNGPATIVFWADDTKTVVKCGEDDVFDPEKGIAMAIARKALGNKRDYFNVIAKYSKKYYKAKKNEAAEITMELKGDILADLTKSIKESFCPQNMEFKVKVKEID